MPNYHQSSSTPLTEMGEEEEVESRKTPIPTTAPTYPSCSPQDLHPNSSKINYLNCNYT